MAVFELKVEIRPDVVMHVEDLLAEGEEQRLMILEDKPAARAWLAGYFESAESAEVVCAQFTGQFAPGWLLANEPTIAVLPDMNWKEAYKEHFKAWQFGQLHWVPVWDRGTFALPPGHAVLWLDPGMAFGTGNHETTRLVVERLVTFAHSGKKGAVLDAGCGSGILALSASKLGFEDVQGFDNDPVAVQVSRENAAVNGLEAAVRFYVADLTSGFEKQADLVLANIQSDVLIRFAPNLLGSVAPGGALVMSGILAIELDAVRSAFAALAPGCRSESRTMGEWTDLVLSAIK